jgi:IclR family pca regulon transcriptional regulator
MSRSTTHRYMITLVALGYVEQDSSRKYRLGLRVTDLGMSALDTGLRRAAREDLEDLRAHARVMTSLSILDQDAVLCLDRLPDYRRGEHYVWMDTTIGAQRPAHATATGKILLASLPDRERQDLLSRLTLTKHTRFTITRKRILGAELLAVRDRGIATSDRELFLDLVAIAAPIRNQEDEVVAAIDLSTNRKTLSLAELADGLGPRLLATADKISKRLSRASEPSEGQQ